MPITNYIWDAVSDNVLMEKDDVGNTIASYEQEPGLYGEIISQRRNGQTSYYNFDGQGSTRELTDQNQTVTDTYAYDAFGVEVARMGTTTNPFAYNGATGYYDDGATDKLSVRTRWYGSQIGRWLSQDPVLFVDGVNRFLYVNANPVNRVDPSGTITVTRVSNRPPANVACGAALVAQWDFRLSAPAPCEGWIVQQVIVNCTITNCAQCDPFAMSAPTQSFSYLEAWHIPINGIGTNIQDTATLRTYDDTCGVKTHVGHIRFLCDSDMRPVAAWRFGASYGTGRCSTFTGPIWSIPTDRSRPSWWTAPSTEADGWRNAQVYWRCCPCVPQVVVPSVWP